MKNYIEELIGKVATNEEVNSAQGNEYGTTDYFIYRNIFEIEADMWIDGISHVTLEVDDVGKITHQIDCI